MDELDFRRADRTGKDALNPSGGKIQKSTPSKTTTTWKNNHG